MTKHIGNRIGIALTAGGGGMWNIYNQFFYQKQGSWPQSPTPPGLTATGGVISDYTSPPGAVYRAHVFTSSGTFTVSALSTNPTLPNSVEYLVVGGGGAGGSAAGGGAGGFRTNVPGYPAVGTAFPVTAGPTSYSVIIGAGAAGFSNNSQSVVANNGSVSVFDNGGPNPISSAGGGGGGHYPGSNGAAGGSGGGGGTPSPPFAGGAGTNYPGPTQQGFPGGSGSTTLYTSGGGGGAGAVGADATPTQSGPGGAGYPIAIETAAAKTYAGGGGGGVQQGPGKAAGAGGAGGGGGGGAWTSATWGLGGSPGGQPGAPGGSLSTSPPFSAGSSPTADGWGGDGGTSTGGGGGGMGVSVTHSGSGGSGIVVVRYQIAQLTATAKATGGAISFYGGKTIHTFTNSGTFTNTSGSPLSVEYVYICNMCN